MNISQVIATGGVAMYILILCSLISITVIIERVVYYQTRARVKRKNFMIKIRHEIEKGEMKRAVSICERAKTPFASVVRAGLNLYGHNEVVISNAMEREIAIETVNLEKRIGIVGTIGSTAVYIGLFGTVLGIIKAFRDIAQKGSGGLDVVMSGISEALVCTAAGLLVAVPAVMAYNYFVKKIDVFVIDMELCVSETMDLLNLKRRI